MTPATPSPTPPVPASRSSDFRKELEQLRLDVNRRIDQIAHGFDDHEDRLDEHERKLESLADGMKDLRTNIHKIQSDVYRFADAVTAQALTAERQEKILATQSKALEAISASTSRTLELLQQRVTL